MWMPPPGRAVSSCAPQPQVSFGDPGHKKTLTFQHRRLPGTSLWRPSPSPSQHKTLSADPSQQTALSAESPNPKKTHDLAHP